MLTTTKAGKDRQKKASRDCKQIRKRDLKSFAKQNPQDCKTEQSPNFFTKLLETPAQMFNFVLS